MKTFLAVCGYWKDVFLQALKHAADICGANWKKMAFSALATAIAIYFLYRTEGWTAAFTRIEWWLILAAAEIGLIAIVFAPVLLMTPFLMVKALKDKHSRIEQDFRTAATEAAAAHANTLHDLGVTKEQSEKLKNEDPMKRVIRSELTARRDGFMRTQKALEARRTDAVESFYDLDWETYTYVRDHIPGYTQYGRNYAPEEYP